MPLGKGTRPIQTAEGKLERRGPRGESLTEGLELLSRPRRASLLERAMSRDVSRGEVRQQHEERRTKTGKEEKERETRRARLSAGSCLLLSIPWSMLVFPNARYYNSAPTILSHKASPTAEAKSGNPSLCLGRRR